MPVNLNRAVLNVISMYVLGVGVSVTCGVKCGQPTRWLGCSWTGQQRNFFFLQCILLPKCSLYNDQVASTPHTSTPPRHPPLNSLAEAEAEAEAEAACHSSQQTTRSSTRTTAIPPLCPISPPYYPLPPTTRSSCPGPSRPPQHPPPHRLPPRPPPPPPTRSSRPPPPPPPPPLSAVTTLSSPTFLPASRHRLLSVSPSPPPPHLPATSNPPCPPSSSPVRPCPTRTSPSPPNIRSTRLPTLPSSPPGCSAQASRNRRTLTSWPNSSYGQSCTLSHIFFFKKKQTKKPSFLNFNFFFLTLEPWCRNLTLQSWFNTTKEWGSN
jgi:hypothetical protein